MDPPECGNLSILIFHGNIVICITSIRISSLCTGHYWKLSAFLGFWLECHVRKTCLDSELTRQLQGPRRTGEADKSLPGKMSRPFLCRAPGSISRWVRKVASGKCRSLKTLVNLEKREINPNLKVLQANRRDKCICIWDLSGGRADQTGNKVDIQASSLSITVDGGATSWDRDHQRRDGDEVAEEGKGRRKETVAQRGQEHCGRMSIKMSRINSWPLSFFQPKLRWFWKMSSKFTSSPLSLLLLTGLPLGRCVHRLWFLPQGLTVCWWC